VLTRENLNLEKRTKEKENLETKKLKENRRVEKSIENLNLEKRTKEKENLETKKTKRKQKSRKKYKKSGKNKQRKGKKKTTRGKLGKKKKRKSKKVRQGKNASKKIGRQANYTSCLAKFIEFARINEAKARSVQQQVKRINSFKKIQDSKKGKKGDFKATYGTLLSALGGNESSPECDGKPLTGNGTRAPDKYKGTLSTLKKCEADIQKMCNYEIDEAKNTTLQTCLGRAEQFKKEFKACYNASISMDDACSCVDKMDMTNFAELKKCNTKADEEKIKKKKKECIKGFAKCKTAQDESVDGVGTCKKINKCGGVKNKTEGERLLKILTPLSKALANTGFADALKSLGLDKGPGSDGNLPGNSSRLVQLRAARFANGRQTDNTDSEGCKEIEKEWKRFNTSGDRAVQGVDGDVDQKETDNTIDSLDKLNNRKTLKKDLDGCAKEDSSRQVTITLTIVRIRFYVFWCGWFQVTVVEVKITIITISFGIPPIIPPPSPPPAPSPVATSAPGGRHIVKQMIKKAAMSK